MADVGGFLCFRFGLTAGLHGDLLPGLDALFSGTCDGHSHDRSAVSEKQGGEIYPLSENHERFCSLVQKGSAMKARFQPDDILCIPIKFYHSTPESVPIRRAKPSGFRRRRKRSTNGLKKTSCPTGSYALASAGCCGNGC